MQLSDIKRKYADDVDLLAEISRLESMERLAMVQNYKLQNVLYLDGVKDQIGKLEYDSVPNCEPIAWVLIDANGARVGSTSTFRDAAHWAQQPGNQIEECYPLLAAKTKLSVRWRPRGIGNNFEIPDLVTGEIKPGCVSDISGFVSSQADAYLAAAIFKGHAYIDFRPSEPNWIQVKVSTDHYRLENLYRLVRENGNILTEDIVDIVIS